MKLGILSPTVFSTIILLFAFPVTAQTTTTNTGTPVGPGGGGAPQLTAQVALTPSQLLVGQTSTLQAVANGGTPEYMYGFLVLCPPANGQINAAQLPSPLSPNSIHSHCSNKIGSQLVLATVADSAGQSAVGQNILTVLGPDTIAVVNGLIDTTFSANGIAVAEFKFAVKKGNELVGGCLSAPVAYKEWDIGDTEPTNWSVGGSVYLSSPLIHLFRHYQKPADFAAKQNGATLVTKNVRIKIEIPKCPNGVATTDGNFIFKVIKKNNNEVTMTFN